MEERGGLRQGKTNLAKIHQGIFNQNKKVVRALKV